MLINLEGMPLLLTAALMTETRQKVVSFLSFLLHTAIKFNDDSGYLIRKGN